MCCIPGENFIAKCAVLLGFMLVLCCQLAIVSYHLKRIRKMNYDIKTFEKDTIVYFDRTEFNLIGYDYYIKDNFCYIPTTQVDKLKKKSSLINSFLINNNNNEICFSEYDFDETYNPFKKD